MISAQDIRDIASLQPEEQTVVLSLVKSFKLCSEQNEDRKRLAEIRAKHLDTNPMTMEEIDKIIHDFFLQSNGWRL